MGSRFKVVPLSPADLEVASRNKVFKQPPGLSKACVFAHYDASGIIHDYVIHSLKAYRGSFDILVFISSSDLYRGQLEKVERYTDIAFSRKNVGHDFMSWRVGWNILQDSRIFDVTFVNDSIYGPNASFPKFINEFQSKKWDLCGATLSSEVRTHVQSYFMRFGQRLVRDGFADEFWNSIDVLKHKRDIIYNYEIGLSANVQEAAYTVGGLVRLEVDSLMKRRVMSDNSVSDAKHEVGRRIMQEDFPNPMQLYWNEVLRQGGCFIKSEIVRSNPLGVCRRAVMDQFQKSGFNVDLIISHLSKTLPLRSFRMFIDELAA